MYYSVLGIENDQSNPDFISGNQISRVGIVANPRDKLVMLS